MKDPHKQRKKFLTALINYGNSSGNFNPHFYKKEMMDILMISEGEFNIIQHNLGNKYCYYVGPHNGEDRYAINMSDCLNLQEQYEKESVDFRHVTDNFDDENRGKRTGVNKKDSITKIEQLIKEMRRIKATAILGASFYKWRRDTAVALSHIFSKTPNYAKDFKEIMDRIEYDMKSIISDNMELEYEKALDKAEVFLESCIREIDEYWLEEGDLAAANNIDPYLSIEKLCSKFHIVAKQLRKRHNNRSTIEVNDEYDVQDLLHAILCIYFDDIRPEEPTQSYAGKSSRMDFLLKEHGIVIETKMTRKGLGSKEVGTQLIDDIARYKQHTDCKTLICFVYDPEGHINNPAGIENDLSRNENGLSVKVLIRPKGY